jgi:HK97 family phage portal protein
MWWPFKKKAEKRAVDPSWGALAGLSTGTGTLVNARMAENLSTVLACVNAISSGLASLPAYVYRWEGGGRVIDESHPLMYLILAGPNQWQSWPDWVEWLMAQVLLRGNALSEIVLDGAGRIVALRPIPWEWVSIQLLPSGRLAYDVVEITNIYGGTGRPRRLLEGEVFHLRDRTDDGLIGRSRLQRAAAVVAAGLNIQAFASQLYRNGVNPSGVLTVDGKLSHETLTRLREHFREAFAGTRNAASAMVLDQGVKWQSISVSPEDAELLASRKFSVEELCRLFQVPPPIIQDYGHNTFTNSETAGRWFAQFTIAPWAQKIQAEFKRSVFSAATRATHELELDLSAFLRGDPETRWKSHEIAVKNGILTINEVRELEGWNPRPDGEVNIPTV